VAVVVEVAVAVEMLLVGAVAFAVAV
jgi:hypothetical protein